ncbi:hypothetical protein CLAIMM_12094 [Cladophialophora immunda]|nr:hypothetical protein CLAIMM_12094 [Cladophialophora immunda]
MTRINAPVNYSRALKETYAISKRVAYQISRVAPSICIGTDRLMFWIDYWPDHPSMHYKQHPLVIKNPGRGPEYDKIMNTIPAPLRSDQKLDFMWKVGKVLIDKVTSPSVIVFYGRYGHEGTTELAKSVTRILTDAVEWTIDDLFGASSKWPDADLVMYLCQERILIGDECKIGDGFAYNNIKRQYVRVCPFALASSIHVKCNMARRDINPSNVLISDKPGHPTILAKVEDFGLAINKITAGIVYDSATTDSQCIATTTTMAVRYSVLIERLCGAFHAMSPALTYVPETGCPYVRSFFPLHSLTSEECAKRSCQEEGRAPYPRDKPFFIHCGIALHVLQGSLLKRYKRKCKWLSEAGSNI